LAGLPVPVKYTPNIQEHTRMSHGLSVAKASSIKEAAFQTLKIIIAEYECCEAADLMNDLDNIAERIAKAAIDVEMASPETAPAPAKIKAKVKAIAHA